MAATALTPAAATPEQIAEAARHRQAAKDCHARAQESWVRSDTDGCLSQWANDKSAQRHLAEAALLEGGGVVEITALFLLDGRVASVRQVEGPYGMSWLLTAEAQVALGRRFLSDSCARKGERRYAANRAKGVTLGCIRVRGVVGATGNGRSWTFSYVARPVSEDLTTGRFDVLTTDSGRGPDY